MILDLTGSGGSRDNGSQLMLSMGLGERLGLSEARAPCPEGRG